MTIDPWGNPYIYVLSGDTRSFDILSLGPDGIEGTEDDARFRNLEAVWNSPGTVRVSTSGTGDGTVRVRVGAREIVVDGGTGKVESAGTPTPGAAER